MAKRPPIHVDQERAGAFGLAAADYDRYRPRYSQPLIAELITGPEQVLDVGAGTGIASVPLMRAGADVLAVEPDQRMARIAASKGIVVEQATFEQWQPRGRTFDLVVFAQSFHWVQPQPALDKITSVLRPGGRLILLSNRITPIAPTRQQLDEAYAGLLDASARPAVDAAHDDEVMAMIQLHGYTVERRHVTEPLHYTTEAWVNMVCTYSNILALAPPARAALRSRLEQRIGSAGVEAENAATAVIYTAV